MSDPQLQPTLDVGIDPLAPESLEVPLGDVQPNVELHAPPPTPAFVASIQDYMLFYGPVLRKPAVPGGTYEVIDGRGRVQACRLIAEDVRKKAGRGLRGQARKAAEAAADELLAKKGIDPIRATVFPAGWGDKAILGELLNLQRRDNLQTSLEAIERWRQFPNMTETDFASRVLKCSLGTLRRRAQLLNLLPELRAALFAGGISQNMALALSRESADFQTQAARKLQTGGLKHEDLRELRQARDTEALETLPPALFAAPSAPGAPPAPAEAPLAVDGGLDPAGRVHTQGFGSPTDASGTYGQAVGLLNHAADLLWRAGHAQVIPVDEALRTAAHLHEVRARMEQAQAILPAAPAGVPREYAFGLAQAICDELEGTHNIPCGSKELEWLYHFLLRWTPPEPGAEVAPSGIELK